MPYYCLYFPTLAIDLARCPGGDHGERPIVLIHGTGDEAVVTAASPLARARGAFRGMTAAHARGRCNSALFLPDNAGACLDEIERFASILRRYATESVAIPGRDHLLLQLDASIEPLVMSRRLLALARTWFKHEVRVGVAASPEAAFETARVAKRAPLVDDSPAELFARPFVTTTDEPLVAAATIHGEGAVALRQEVFRLLVRLEAILAGRSQGFRSFRVEVEIDEQNRVLALNFDNPAYTADDVLRRLERHLNAPQVAGARYVRVTLDRLCPDVRQRVTGEAVTRVPLRAAG